MSHYQHLSIEERESIWAYSLKGVSKREIARRLGRDVSTISRELKRNRVEGEYRPSVAQKRYEQRRTGCRRPYILAQKELCNAVVQHLTEEQWSPEQIANRLALERGESIISYSTIYRAIHAGRLEPKGKQNKKRLPL